MDAPFSEAMMPKIHEFFSSESTRVPGEDIYEDVFNTDLFFPLQRKRELVKMLDIARTYEPKVIYEIGTCDGGGLYHWCKSVTGVERVIATEVRGTPYQHEFEEAFPNIDFLWIAESSYAKSTIDTIYDWLDGDMVDVLFIDGDKSHFDTDFNAVNHMMSSPSVVFMHDITDSAPGAAFDRVVARGFRHERVVDRQDSEEAVNREIAGEPCRNGYEGWLRHWNGQSCGVGVIYLD